MGPPPSPNLNGCDSSSLAFSLRPNPSSSNHKSHLRVSLNRGYLAKLDLKVGDLCSISAVPKVTTNGTVTEDGRIGELQRVESHVKVYPAIAWTTSDAQVSGKVVQVSEQLKDLIGVGFQSKVAVGPYVGKTGLARNVVLVEVGEDGGAITKVDKSWHIEGPGWSYIIQNELCEGKYVFKDMVMSGIKYLGVKRHFKVKSVEIENEEDGISAEIAKNKEIISAYRITLKTTAIIEELRGLRHLVHVRSAPGTPLSAGKSEPSTPKHESTVAGASPPEFIGPTFHQIGGLEPQLGKITETIISTLRHYRRFTSLGLTPFRGILLYGTPGTGKSLIMRAIPNSLPIRNISIFKIDGSIIGPYRGEPEAKIRETFKNAKESQPSIILLDEIDIIASKRDRDTQDTIVGTLLAELDALHDNGQKVFIVAASNKPGAIDEGLRRPGRLDCEIEISRPDAAARYKILKLLLAKVKKAWLLQDDEDSEGGIAKEDTVVKGLVAKMHGYVGADLAAVARRALLAAVGRLPAGADLDWDKETNNDAEENCEVVLTIDDMEEAMKQIKPTVMREIVFEIPNIRWSDIGGQEIVKDRLREAVEWPLKHPEVFKRLGAQPHKGLLLYGPPGCSKTLTAKALAAESGLNFMPIKGPELLNMYVGETERAIREVFAKARTAAPSIIFFDEIDAIGATRSEVKNGSGSLNILTSLLNEMDGIEDLKDVTILAATNRPELLDPALMRPGRLGAILYVAPPDLAARREIFKIKKKKMSFHENVDIEELAILTDGFSGAEVVKICDEACHYAMRESFDIDSVHRRHFDMALRAAVKQITPDMRRFYEGWSIGGVKRL